MNVRQLVKVLQTLPPEARVCLEDEDALEVSGAYFDEQTSEYGVGAVLLETRVTRKEE